MNKFKSIAIILAFVIIVYLLMMIFMPIVAGFAESTNAEMASSSNMTNYPGTAGFLTSMPWILWFVPGVIGMISIVVTLKRG